jgi:hypothetical protein
VSSCKGRARGRFRYTCKNAKSGIASALWYI